jgi:hypothetical protein
MVKEIMVGLRSAAGQSARSRRAASSLVMNGRPIIGTNERESDGARPGPFGHNRCVGTTAASHFDLAADLHEVLRRQVEAISGVNRIAMQEGEQAPAPRRHARVALAPCDVVSFAEISRVVEGRRDNVIFPGAARAADRGPP